MTFDTQNPTDMLGQSIQVGDIVVRAEGYGSSSSPTLTIFRIERFKWLKPSATAGRVNEECPRGEALFYNLVLVALRSTGYMSLRHRVTGDSPQRMFGPVWQEKLKEHRSDFEGETSTIKLVKNILRLGDDVTDVTGVTDA